MLWLVEEFYAICSTCDCCNHHSINFSFLAARNGSWSGMLNIVKCLWALTVLSLALVLLCNKMNVL